MNELETERYDNSNRSAHLVPQRCIRVTRVDEGSKCCVGRKIFHELLHSFEALDEIDDSLLLVLCDWQEGQNLAKIWVIEKKGKRLFARELWTRWLTSWFKVMITSSMHLPRIVGIRSPIVR